MKKLFFLAVLFIGATGALYYLPIKQDSALYGLKSFVVEKGASVKMSSADPQGEIRNKEEELRAYENAIAQIDAEDERIRADGPVCPTTGEKAISTITSDPRPELREKIQRLRSEIADLESKI